MRTDSDGVYYRCKLKSNHFAEFLFWCEYQEDGGILPTVSQHLYLTVWIHVTYWSSNYLSAVCMGQKPRPPTHTHKHTCLPALAHWLTLQRLWCFFVVFFLFFWAFTLVLLGLLLFSFKVCFCLCLLNNFLKHFIIQNISAPSLV